MLKKFKGIITKSAEETKKVASDFAKAKLSSAKKIKKGQILALTGNLGSGKTTFVKGLAKSFGIKEQVTSPSFVIIKEYKIRSQVLGHRSQGENLVHIDLYRIKKIDQNLKNQILENFVPENICLIEWAERTKKILPKKTKWIKFEFIDQNKRKIIFE